MHNYKKGVVHLAIVFFILILSVLAVLASFFVPKKRENLTNKTLDNQSKIRATPSFSKIKTANKIIISVLGENKFETLISEEFEGYEKYILGNIPLGYAYADDRQKVYYGNYKKIYEFDLNNRQKKLIYETEDDEYQIVSLQYKNSTLYITKVDTGNKTTGSSFRSVIVELDLNNKNKRILDNIFLGLYDLPEYLFKSGNEDIIIVYGGEGGGAEGSVLRLSGDRNQKVLDIGAGIVDSSPRYVGYIEKGNSVVVYNILPTNDRWPPEYYLDVLYSQNIYTGVKNPLLDLKQIKRLIWDIYLNKNQDKAIIYTTDDFDYKKGNYMNEISRFKSPKIDIFNLNSRVFEEPIVLTPGEEYHLIKALGNIFLLARYKNINSSVDSMSDNYLEEILKINIETREIKKVDTSSLPDEMKKFYEHKVFGLWGDKILFYDVE